MQKYTEPEMNCVMFAVEDIIGCSSDLPYPTESKPELNPIDPDEGAIV